MSDRYERDKDGTITGKAITEDPGTGPKVVEPQQGRPVDKAGENSTLASRGKARTKAVKAADVEDKSVSKASTKKA